MTELDWWCAASGKMEMPIASVEVDVAGALGAILMEISPAVRFEALGGGGDESHQYASSWRSSS